MKAVLARRPVPGEVEGAGSLDAMGERERPPSLSYPDVSSSSVPLLKPNSGAEMEKMCEGM